MTRRNKRGEVIAGKGVTLSPLQEEFLQRVAAEGLDRAGEISREMGYTNYYRDRKNFGTKFYRELMSISEAEMKDVEAAKGMNLKKLITIRDNAMAMGDMKMAMEAIKIINSMQGFIAPTKVEQTKFDVKATIDLTAPKKEEDNIFDIEYEEEDED